MTYLVIAYRWGWINNHQYHVYAGQDKTKAIALALAEAHSRAGKYGCAVYGFDEDGTSRTLEVYFSSAYGERKPSHNDRIDMFEKLGYVLYDYSRGMAYLPDPEKEGCLKPTKVEPPEWVVAEVKRAEEFAEAMLEAERKREGEE